ncbi:MAG TPA: ABC transporter permease subunit, partial [Anaerolineales bacterium]
IDGASEFRIFWQIVIPNTGPALVTLGVFNMVGVWNSFLWPLLVVQSKDMYTIPLALNNLRTFGMEQQSLTLQMAGTVLGVLPTLVVFVFLQRYFTRGIALTGLKG